MNKYCYWWAHHCLREVNSSLRRVDEMLFYAGYRDQSILNLRLRLLQFKADIEEWSI